MLELWAVFLALKHFLQYLQERHVLVKTDHCVKTKSTVVYINCQGRNCSLQLHRLAQEVIMCSSTRLLPLQETCAGHLEQGCRSSVMGNPLYREWTLHPQVLLILRVPWWLFLCGKLLEWALCNVVDRHSAIL